MQKSVAHDTAGSPLQPSAMELRASRWTDWVPGIQMLRHYEARWLRNDLVAGIVLSTMPGAGIAYAVASGVPAINGLYATIVPLLFYALFGPSRILVLGPDSLAPIILGVVLPLSLGDPARAVSIAAAMAIVAGSVCIIAGIARLGFITELLSKPIRYGYMNGIALAVLISQLRKPSVSPSRARDRCGTSGRSAEASWRKSELGRRGSGRSNAPAHSGAQGA